MEEKELSTKELQQFEVEFYDNAFPNQRYGQAACNYFKLPKEIEAHIFYDEDETYCRNILWQFTIIEGL